MFVYGTLRRCCRRPEHEELVAHAEFVGPGTIQGRLYEVDGYPGAVDSDDANERVHGELYRIRDAVALFAVLDEYEEYSARFPTPHEYVRAQRTVAVEDGGHVQACIYLYHRPTHERRRIICGDYAATTP
nr:gamma-glutamylcyclotransferase family protein [Solimonas marina]